MKKTFIRIESQTCPHCHTRQTVFIQDFGVKGDPLIGYECAVSSCRKFTAGQDYYTSSGATVGDFKTT